MESKSSWFFSDQVGPCCWKDFRGKEGLTGVDEKTFFFWGEGRGVFIVVDSRWS